MNNLFIEKTRKRTERSWFEDGLWDIAFASLCLMIALYYFAIEALRLETRLGGLIALLQIGVFLLAFWGMGKGIRYLKQRITYPRIGYAVFRKSAHASRRSRALRGLIIGTVVGGTAGLIASTPLGEVLLPVMMCALFGVMSLWLGWRFGVLRYYLIAVACVGLGFLILRLPFNTQLTMASVFGGLGVIWLLSGTMTLILFLRHTPPQSSDAQDPDAETTGKEQA